MHHDKRTKSHTDDQESVLRVITYSNIIIFFRVNVDPNEEIETEEREDSDGQIHQDVTYERSWLVRKWHQFDVKYVIQSNI